MQTQAKMLREEMSTMPIKDNMAKMNEHKKLQTQVNQLWDEQHKLAQILEPLQEKALQISQDVGGTQDTIKQIVRENEEKVEM